MRFTQEQMLVCGACKVDEDTVKEDGESAQNFQSIHPVADTITYFRLESPGDRQIFDLNEDLDSVANPREERGQREKLSKEHDISELYHKLHVVVK